MVEPLPSDRLFAANRTFLHEARRYAPELDEGQSIEGLIHPREGLLLYALARRAAQSGNIVQAGHNGFGPQRRDAAEQ